MPNRPWTEEELSDLKLLDRDEFVEKYDRSLSAVNKKRYNLNIGVVRHPTSVQLCSYCSTSQGECKCAEGRTCRDRNCMFYIPKRGKNT